MWEWIKNTALSVIKGRVGHSINRNMGIAAGVGGYLLAATIFYGAKITKKLAIYFSAAVPATIFTALLVSDYVRYRLYFRRAPQYKTDKKMLKRAIRTLRVHLDSKNKKSYIKMLDAMKKTNNNDFMDLEADARELALIVTKYIEQNCTTWQTTIHSAAMVIDVLANFFGGASAILIDFAIPVIFDPSIHTKEINYQVLAISTVFGLYASLYDLIVLENARREMMAERKKVNQLANRFLKFYKQLPDQSHLIKNIDLAELMKLDNEDERNSFELA